MRAAIASEDTQPESVPGNDWLSHDFMADGANEIGDHLHLFVPVLHQHCVATCVSRHMYCGSSGRFRRLRCKLRCRGFCGIGVCSNVSARWGNAHSQQQRLHQIMADGDRDAIPMSFFFSREKGHPTRPGLVAGKTGEASSSNPFHEKSKSKLLSAVSQERPRTPPKP